MAPPRANGEVTGEVILMVVLGALDRRIVKVGKLKIRDGDALTDALPTTFGIVWAGTTFKVTLDYN